MKINYKNNKLPKAKLGDLKDEIIGKLEKWEQ